jgi:hypothetical protein
MSRSTSPALEVTGNLDKEERRAGRSGNDLRAELTGCDGGVEKRLREEGFLADISPLSSVSLQSRGRYVNI